MVGVDGKAHPDPGDKTSPAPPLLTHPDDSPAETDHPSAHQEERPLTNFVNFPLQLDPDADTTFQHLALELMLKQMLTNGTLPPSTSI
eukprot:10691929-Ditylum_brightwellii.AAC.1